MEGILQELPELPCTHIFVIMATISFVLHIISLKKWFDNRVKNEKLLGWIQSLAERIYTIENDNLNLTDKIQSMPIGYETLQKDTERLSKRIHTVEIDN